MVEKASKIHGMKELQKALQVIGPKMGGNTLRGALRDAAKPVLASAQSRVPVGSVSHKTYKGRLVGGGFASRNVKMKATLSRDKRSARVMIGVAPEAFYAAQFLELGTSKIRRRPWLRPALASQRNNVNDLFRQRMARRLELLAKRLARKTARL